MPKSRSLETHEVFESPAESRVSELFAFVGRDCGVGISIRTTTRKVFSKRANTQFAFICLTEDQKKALLAHLQAEFKV